jgi:serine/threonine protein kinase
MAEETRQLGRYELIKRIAVGGMGVIYLAKSRGAAGFEKTVIIKKILDHLAEEQEFITKFLDEGRIVVNLTHGNIVPVFDMGEEDGEYFIAMEYLPGRDLRDVLKRLQKRDEIIPVHLAVHIVTEVCKGLDYAHRRTDDAGNSLDIVHRDVSPSNILISRDGEVKVIDFGIARATSRAAKTVSGRIQGKICYMSPEQASGQSVDARSDIFSAGVVLYEMLTGKRPFQGESDLQSLDLVRKCNFQTPSELNPEIPPELDAIVEKALERDRDERYQSIDELHVDLLEWLYSGGRAVTSQQLSEFVHQLFPEGFEREELRKARDASSAQSADRPMNLDDALNAELEKLEKETPKPNIDPLSTTATELADGPADLKGGQTSTLSQPAGAAGTPTHPPETDSSPDVDTSNTNTGSSNTGNSNPDAGSQPSLSGDTPLPAQPTGTATGEAQRDADQPTGFKRWLAVALGVGILAGAAVIYAYAATEYGKVEVRTEPAGASIEVDGVKVSGAKTPHTLELETGNRAISVLLDGYEPQTIKHKVKRGKKQLLDNGTIELEPVEPDDEPRQAWVTVRPTDALIKIDNGEKSAQGKAKITVEPDKQVLVEASHPNCQTATRVVNYEGAAQPITFELECTEPQMAQADAGPDVGSNASADNTEQAAERRNTVQRVTHKVVRFSTRPAGGTITIDGEPTDGAERLRIGQKVDLHAELPGYAPVDKQLRVTHNLRSRYTIELAKLGCLQVRHPQGQLFTITIDGGKAVRSNNKRFSLAPGKHQVYLKDPQGRSKTYTVDITSDANNCEWLGPNWLDDVRN